MPKMNARILAVDDEVKICENCVKILSRQNHEVSYALDGYNALKLIDRQDFAVVVTDLKISSMGGMELLRRIQQGHPDTMVIVITAYATVSSAVEVMKMGAVDYLAKPFTAEELRGAVTRARSPGPSITKRVYLSLPTGAPYFLTRSAM